MSDMSAEQFLGMITCLGILGTAIFAPLRCEQHSKTIDKIIKKQCSQIDSRKDYEMCVEGLLK